MAERAKIDSNETGAFFAEETTIGVLPVTPDWYPLEPNSYDEFGSELTLLARRPINNSRQRKKGAITDLDASGGFNQDFTQTNCQRLLQGFMFASYREKLNSAVTAVTATGYTVADEAGFAAGQLVLASGFGTAANNGLKVVTGTDTGEVTVSGLTIEGSPPAAARLLIVGFETAAGDLDVDSSGAWPAFTSTTLDFEDLGLVAGEFIYVGGDLAGEAFTTAANNGIKRVRSIDANRLEIDKSTLAMATEANTTQTVRLFFGRVLKNELGELIVRRTYNVERQLGAPDTAEPTEIQSEYLVGAVPSEMTLTVEQADKLNADFSFVALDNEQRTATVGIKAGNRHPLVESDAYNTSSDFNSLRLAIFDGATAAPLPLFAHLLDYSVTINNNLSVNKAVAVLGGFEVTAGIFEVAVEMNCYFSTIEAVQAIRTNENVTLHSFLAKSNAGFVFDLPLGALGDGRLEVEIDEPIMLPVTMDAATAVSLNPNTDYTCMWVFFDYLPTVAEI